MRDLHVTGLDDAGQFLLLSDGEQEFRVPVREDIRVALRRADRLRRHESNDAPEEPLRPRDVQALIRAGATAEEAAERAGWSPEKVSRYEAPILAERAHVVRLAQAVIVRGRMSQPLESIVTSRLDGRGVDTATVAWDSTRGTSGPWTVVCSFLAGGREREATWHFDVHDRALTAQDDEARWLSEDESTRGDDTDSVLPRRPRPAHERPAEVYDQAASQESAPSAPSKGRARRRSKQDDLVSSMRERSSGRGRRRRAKQDADDGRTIHDQPLPLDVEGADDLDEARRSDSAASSPKDDEATAAKAHNGAAKDSQDSAHGDSGEAGKDAASAASDSADDTVDSQQHSAEDRDDAGDSGDSDSGDSDASHDDSDSDGDAAASGQGSDAEEEQGKKAKAPAKGKSRKSRRPSVPSWDDIMFGTRPDPKH